MKISKTLERSLNGQINAELYSAYLYLSMAAYFDAANLSGMAHWMKKQAGEEQEHAMKFYDFIYERGGSVKLEAIETPESEWDSPLQAFQTAYEHEQKVTSLINGLYEQALGEKDMATQVMLHWFIDEQVEEEDAALTIVEKLKMAGESKQGLLMLDHSLGER